MKIKIYVQKMEKGVFNPAFQAEVEMTSAELNEMESTLRAKTGVVANPSELRTMDEAARSGVVFVGSTKAKK